MSAHHCYECVAGEHDDYSEVEMVLLTDPDKKNPPKRGYLCQDHIDCAEQDGWTVRRERSATK